jgi:ubiquinone biosynthesis protein
VFRQIFEDNHFHTDMHPGNVILLRDSQFSVIDSRGVGMLESESLSKHRKLMEAITDQNYALAADIYLFLAAELPVVEITEVRSRLIRAFRTWETRTHVPVVPFREKSITCLLQELNAITFHYKFASQWSLSKLARTWANLDASLEHLWPEINYLRQMRKYFRQATRRDDRKFYRSNTNIARNLAEAAEFPKRMSQYELFRQTIVRRQAQVFQGSTNRIGYIVSAMLGWVALTLLLTGTFVATVLLYQHHDVSIQSLAGNQLSQAVSRVPEASYVSLLAILVLLLYLFRVARRLAKSLRQTNVRVPEARATV